MKETIYRKSRSPLRVSRLPVVRKLQPVSPVQMAVNTGRTYLIEVDWGVGIDLRTCPVEGREAGICAVEAPRDVRDKAHVVVRARHQILEEKLLRLVPPRRVYVRTDSNVLPCPALVHVPFNSTVAASIKGLLRSRRSRSKVSQDRCNQCER